jgi:HSP20 family molecular chaperone IbpA
MSGESQNAVWDITENDEEYRISAELPGFSKDEIGIDVGESNLTIKAKSQRRTENETG